MPKAVELNRTLETDDGIFNVRWWEDHNLPREIPCGWTVLGGKAPCSKVSRDGNFWCVECGLVVCDGHRVNHQYSQQHLQRPLKIKLIPRHKEV